MQLAKANTHRGADLPNRFGMRKSLAVGGEVEEVADRREEKSDGSTTALFSRKRKSGFASNPIHANSASNNPALAHSVGATREPTFSRENLLPGIVSKRFCQGVFAMSSLALLESLKESILSHANVKAVYGEPVAAQGKTVIPVAKVIYGYGAGAGTGGVGDSHAHGEGGGGGGGARAIPVGVIEISDQQTRFVPITDRKKLTAATVAGIGLGIWLSWRRRH
jgi:uncharacterized spore protein YtfJ